MKRLVFGMMLTIAFLVGCLTTYVARDLVVPPARANTNPQKWEYICFKGYVWGSGPIEPESVTATANKLGREGWELVSGDGRGNYCFKRPLP